MSIIAYKIENNRIIVGADGRLTSGDLIINENADKIYKISDSLIIGATGLSDATDIFKKFVEENKEIFENIHSSEEFLEQAKELKEYFMEHYGYRESTIMKEFGGFLIVNKYYHGTLYYSDENCFPYIIGDAEKNGCLGSPAVYAQALLDIGCSIDNAIKVTARRYNSINDNVKLLEIKL